MIWVGYAANDVEAASGLPETRVDFGRRGPLQIEGPLQIQGMTTVEFDDGKERAEQLASVLAERYGS
ncbi:MAG TPA: hypothetical protein VKB88_45555 [Bryobacteraceae bacterium]|nr:hypothetical protein [Bryobacteraceae bacterium]